MSFCKVFMSGNITGEIKTGKYNGDKTWCSFSIASNLGFGDNKKTVYMQCGAFGKSAENIAKYFAKGDEIIIVSGELSQKEYEGKKYTTIVINEWTFGKMKDRECKPAPAKSAAPSDPFADDVQGEFDDPFSDDQIPF